MTIDDRVGFKLDVANIPIVTARVIEEERFIALGSKTLTKVSLIPFFS